MKTELIEKLDSFLLNSDISAVSSEVRTLQNNYEQHIAREADLARQEFVNGGGLSKDFNYEKTAEDLRLEELFRSFRELRKIHEKQIAAEQSKNLEIKQNIIKQIKALGDIQSQPGKAIKSLKDLQTHWKETGAVSPHVYKELQNEYSKSVEAFYYSLDIYKVLQDHDFKKNFELKSAIIEKVNLLGTNPSIKEIERLMKVYRNEWEEIGPIQNDKWDSLKTQWRSGLDLVYGKLKAHYQSVEEQKEKNMLAKQALIDKALALANQVAVDEEGWKKSTEEILAFQKEWKSTGYSSKGKGEELWNTFRATCDRFFESKNAFYAVIREARSGLRKQKTDLIEKAEALSNSTEWKDTSDKMIRLQADWKKIPGTGLQEEPRLFHRFRKACNAFFDAKKKHFEELDAASANLVTAREAMLATFQATPLTGNALADQETLTQQTNSWSASPALPAREQKRLNELFYTHMDELWAKLNVNAEELAMIRFKNKLDRLKQEDSSGNLLQKEYDLIKKNAEQIHLDVLKYENNLGMFKSSKGDNPLLNDIKSKIEQEKVRLAQVKIKQKMAREILDQTLV